MIKTILLIVILFGSSQAQELRGKVLSGNQPVSKATVIVTDSDGKRLTVLTNKCGEFLFKVSRGTYVVGAAKRRYRFTSKTVNVDGQAYVELGEGNE